MSSWCMCEIYIPAAECSEVYVDIALSPMSLGLYPCTT